MQPAIITRCTDSGQSRSGVTSVDSLLIFSCFISQWGRVPGAPGRDSGQHQPQGDVLPLPHGQLGPRLLWDPDIALRFSASEPSIERPTQVTIRSKSVVNHRLTLLIWSGSAESLYAAPAISFSHSDFKIVYKLRMMSFIIYTENYKK